VGCRSARWWGKWFENRKKILNRGNELKDLLKAKGLEFFGVENELVFERKKGQKSRQLAKNSPVLALREAKTAADKGSGSV
jgi:hypothetical protein